MKKNTWNLLKIFFANTTILACLGFFSVVFLELETYIQALFAGRPYIPPYFDYISIGVYVFFFSGAVLAYFIPCAIGVSIIMIKPDFYLSTAKKASVGLMTGLIGALMFFLLEYLLPSDRANNLSEMAALLFIPFGLTITSVILFIKIPPLIGRGQK